MRVLLVDDSSTMRKIQKRTLCELDIDEIVEAENGKEALKKLAQYDYQFDFMMCDINMPEMSGMETLRAVRSNPQSAKIPVIMCTSVAEKSQVIEAIKAGASNYVVKPFKPDDLKAKVNAVLNK